jgi:hypothetical protein
VRFEVLGRHACHASNAGFEASTATVDVSSRDAVRALVEKATALGDITGLIHAAGVSPTQASQATILTVDLYGTALVLEEFGNVIARGGSGVVIASQSGHRLPPRSPSNRTRRWPPRPWKICSVCPSCTPTGCWIRSMHTNSPSAGTRCA